MKREEIICMAREAGFVVGVMEGHRGDVPYAKLCHPTPNQTGLYSMLENLIRKATAAEREACAKVCEAGIAHATDWDSSYWDQACENRATAIRARGEATSKGQA